MDVLVDISGYFGGYFLDNLLYIWVVGPLAARCRLVAPEIFQDILVDIWIFWWIFFLIFWCIFFDNLVDIWVVGPLAARYILVAPAIFSGYITPPFSPCSISIIFTGVPFVASERYGGSPVMDRL